MNNTDKIVLILLVLQAGSTIYLWTLDALNQISEGKFALFVGVDLLAFAMVSYMYRASRSGAGASKGWMLVGSVLILVLILSSAVLR